ncbi:4Fe-4S dicluster domain-containing protein [Geomesophilobacter sediminis]|uniref:4Fe-4S binding protein n=1 Tax=Geomesophilobacter sediminis TaxID=2798584 RepID=A0A8J7IMP4_9BACT|nr:4Fe-4S dicluster domain-containing protein [Geomesophilobacter sediminis]MBJ6724113.1 4Fe-4S binding protein [Geomesophilobacter sediminis]
MPATHSRIAPQRKLVQWLATLFLLAIPFVQIGGNSLLRLDAPSRTLLFLGAQIRIEEFYLFLLVALVGSFGFLFVTMLFGRVWCGWFCPQTTITDLAEWLDRKVRSAVGRGLSGKLLRHLGYLVLSFTVAANLVWYFIPPAAFWHRLTAGSIGPVAGIFLTATLILVYLDLTWVRGAFCKSICPYGRIQHMTMDRNTLTLEFDRERTADCIACGACARICPMGIDIKDGLQIECINCGRCVDACRDVMGKMGKEGLIRYSFGAGGQGTPFNARVIASGALVVLLSGILVAGVATRKEATVKVQRSAGGEVKTLPDGSVVNFYTAYLENRGTKGASFTLAVAPQNGVTPLLVGPVRDVSVEANGNRRVDFAIKLAPAPSGPLELKLQLLRDGKPVGSAALPVLAR